jgi:hypothetical protein
MLTIARFNWPLYLTAFIVLIASGTGAFLLAGFLKIYSVIALACAAYFIFISLGVSHVVYDRSELYRWSWLDRALQDVPVRKAIFCHCGFDETSSELRERYRDVQWNILDHYEPERMTEPSIHRARVLFPPAAGTLACRYDDWPLAAESADVIFGLLAIHELRSETERTVWFTKARRSLRPGGRVILVEHMRDAANFLAFGPGFLHFHSCASWRRCWERAGLHSVNQFTITPFVQVFVLNGL